MIPTEQLCRTDMTFKFTLCLNADYSRLYTDDITSCATAWCCYLIGPGEQEGVCGGVLVWLQRAADARRDLDHEEERDHEDHCHHHDGGEQINVTSHPLLIRLS